LRDGTRGTGQPNVNGQTLGKLVLPLPPLAEQHSIVAKVDELMALCDRLEMARTEREVTRDRLEAASLARLNAPGPDPATFADHARFALNNLVPLTTRPDQIKRLRQTILNLAVRGKLVPQDPEEKAADNVALEIIAKRRGQIREAIEQPFALPRGWAWRAVDTIADQVTDGEHATPPRIAEPQVPLVTAKNVRDGFMDYVRTDWVSYATAEKAWGRCRPAVGDLLLVCVGATTGRLTVLREPQDMVLVRSVALIRPNRDADPEYLERAIRSSVVQQQIWASVKAAAQPCLYINRIQSLLIPLPHAREPPCRGIGIAKIHPKVVISASTVWSSGGCRVNQKPIADRRRLEARRASANRRQKLAHVRPPSRNDQHIWGRTMANLLKPLHFVIPVVMFMPVPASAHDHQCCRPAMKALLNPASPPCPPQTLDYADADCSGSNNAEKNCLLANLKDVLKQVEFHTFFLRDGVCNPNPVVRKQKAVLDCNPPVTSMCDAP
jgi:Type I restriction modification DNA specificity domain